MLNRLISSFCQIVDTITRWAFYLGAALLVAMLALVVEQVIARYFFSASSIALQELQWHLFGAAFLLGIAHTYKENKHVRVDFLSARFSRKAQNVREGIGLLLAIPLCALLTWYGWKYAELATSFPATRPLDHYSTLWFDKDSTLYAALSPVENVLRSTVFVGEASSDPGGLEARWIIKAFFPLAMLLLLLQCIAEGLKLLLPTGESRGS